jgi:hypothetical protein
MVLSYATCYRLVKHDCITSCNLHKCVQSVYKIYLNMLVMQQQTSRCRQTFWLCTTACHVYITALLTLPAFYMLYVENIRKKNFCVL